MNRRTMLKSIVVGALAAVLPIRPTRAKAVDRIDLSDRIELNDMLIFGTEGGVVVIDVNTPVTVRNWAFTYDGTIHGS